MYRELYEVWRRELQSGELDSLPADFYSKVADYLRRLKEEGRMLDKRTVKARLLKSETQNVKRMVCEMARVRYRKLLQKASAGEKVSHEFLAVEEERLLSGVLPLAEGYRIFTAGLLRGQLVEMAVQAEKKGKRVALRFLAEVPVVIGVDMKPYGPFKIEDVASLPVENARLLVKQGMAEKVEAG
jgi:DNA replication factor GINS